jgi:outer membrane biogenesis lipoprotein LolB
VSARGTHALGMTARGALVLLAAVAALAGCGETAQTAGQGAAKKADAKAWEGAQTTVYMADGYKSGDKTAWEAQLKARTERGQNEYTRTQK